jgi:phosphoglycolate phosphatase
MKYKGIIFDLDGTLADTLEDIGDSMNRVLRQSGFPEHGYEAYRYFVGRGLENLVREALPENSRDGDMVAGCLNTMVDDYRKNCLVKTRLYDGVPEMLDELAHRSIKLAIFSNKADDLTKIIAKGLLDNWDFKAVFGARPGIPRKPDPEGALLASRQMGIGPQDILYLGDTDVDMITADKAGMFAVGALWGFRTGEELLANGAKMLLHHPVDLLNLLT